MTVPSPRSSRFWILPGNKGRMEGNLVERQGLKYYQEGSHQRRLSMEVGPLSQSPLNPVLLQWESPAGIGITDTLLPPSPALGSLADTGVSLRPPGLRV